MHAISTQPIPHPVILVVEDAEALRHTFQAILEDLDRSRLKSQTPHYAELYPILIAPALALLLGGPPFPEPILMWWNFVGRTREEISEARRQWSADDGRFGRVRSSLDRIEVGAPPWE